VPAELVRGSGQLELLVATMDGHLLALETGTAATPLRVRGRGGGGAPGRGRPGAHAEGSLGCAIEGAPSGAREVVGERFDVRVLLSDPPRRRPTAAAAAGGRYALSLELGGVEVARLNVTRTGAHDLRGLRAPGGRTRAPLRLRVVDAHGRVAEDEIVLTFNPSVHRLLKWLVAAPALALGALALLPVAGGGGGGGAREATAAGASQ
jgi:hypothetical protein